MSESRRVICRVRLREGVLDPQGVTIRKALQQLGYEDVLDVRSGKEFELVFRNGVDRDVVAVSEEICRKLLANPVIEDFEVEEL